VQGSCQCGLVGRQECPPNGRDSLRASDGLPPRWQIAETQRIVAGSLGRPSPLFRER